LVLEFQMVKEYQFWFQQFADVDAAIVANWSADYMTTGAPTTWTTGQTQTFSVTLTNNGNQSWPASGANPVHLGVHFANVGGGAGANTWYTDQRFSLPADLAPGANVTLTIAVTAPTKSTGNLVLEFQMVKEYQFWFQQFADVDATIVSLLSSEEMITAARTAWTAC